MQVAIEVLIFYCLAFERFFSQEGSSSDEEGTSSSTAATSSLAEEPNGNDESPRLRPIPPPLHHDKLALLSVPQLNEAHMELETVIGQYSETLISQLALRDELDYQKELKNSFISLLLQVQNRRRNFSVDKKRVKKSGPNGTDPKVRLLLA